MCIHRLNNICEDPTQPTIKARKPTLTVHYENKGFDLIRAFQIFKTNKSQNYNKPSDVDNNRLHPSIRYNYTQPFGVKLFNFKETTTNTAKMHRSTWKSLCKCSKYPDYVDETHNHVVTGDTSIISNIKLRNIINKGPKFRLPKQPDWDAVQSNYINGIQRYIKTQLSHQLHNKTYWLEIQHQWINNLIHEINNHKDKEHITDDYSQYALTFIEQSAIKELRNSFVISTVDKANQNYSFTCKYFYLNNNT